MNRIAAVILVGLLLVTPMMTGCGNSGQKLTQGPNAVLNGGSIASATSHWVAQACGVQVEITSDGGFYSVVTDTSNTTWSGVGTWTASGANGLVTSGFGAEGFFWVAELANISGSTSSGAFAAVTTVDGTGTQQTLGNCMFALQQGAIQIPVIGRSSVQVRFVGSDSGEHLFDDARFLRV